jgi:hypothetical protein
LSAILGEYELIERDAWTNFYKLPSRGYLSGLIAAAEFLSAAEPTLSFRSLITERLRLFEIERRIRGSVRRVTRFFQERANDLGI